MEDHLAFRVAYRGTAFQGFQIQKHGETIQGRIEKALFKIFGKKIRIRFTSRTDAGAHAYDQIVFVQQGMALYDQLSARKKKHLHVSINHLFGDEICAWEMGRLKSQFQIKKDVLWKEYVYFVLNSPTEDPLLREMLTWIRQPLDLKKMRKSQRQLVGCFDFSSFAKSSGRALKARGLNTQREILQASIQLKKHPGNPSAKLFMFRFRGKGFLQHMVRNMVGSLVDIGAGRELDIHKILSGRSRPLAGRAMPSKALFLMQTKISKRVYAPRQRAEQN